ncbi:MAG: serine/threonine-protein kinase, partial [Planctomycetota bacterium]
MELIEGRTLGDVCHISRTEVGAAHSPGQVAADAETSAIARLTTDWSTDRGAYYRQIAQLGIEAAAALHFAHEQGVVHRDVKPSNLLLDHAGGVHVADFGLARIASDSDLTMTGDVVGTLRYMSPEAIEDSSRADRRSDVYSLGATLYELIVGQPPLNENNRAALLRRVLESAPTRLRRIDGRVPADLETIVHHCLEKSPDLRYQTAEDLAKDLRRFRDNRPIAARRSSTATHVWRWAGRNRVLAAAVGVALVALLALAVGGPFLALRVSASLENERQLTAELTLEQANLASQLYARRVRNAFEAADRQDFHLAETVLSDYHPVRNPHAAGADRPGFEYWMLQARRHDMKQRTIASHWVDVTRVALSPDGRWIAYADWVGSVTVRDLQTNEAVFSDSLQEGEVAITTDLHFSPDSKLLLAVGGTRIGLWDVERGLRLEVSTPEVEGPRRQLYAGAFGAIDGRLVFAVGDFENEAPIKPSRLLIYAVDASGDPATVEIVQQLDGCLGATDAITFTPDNQQLIAGGNAGRLKRWKLPEFKELEPLDIADGWIREVWCHPRWANVVAVSLVRHQPEYSLSTLALVNLMREPVVHVLQQRPVSHNALALTPEGKRLLVGYSDGEVWEWNASAADESLHLPLVARRRLHQAAVTDLACSPDGKSFYSTGAAGEVRRWPPIPADPTRI